MIVKEFECKKCGDICMIDGDFPKYFCWCDTCHDYAAGFDPDDKARWIASSIADEHDFDDWREIQC